LKNLSPQLIHWRKLRHFPQDRRHWSSASYTDTLTAIKLLHFTLILASSVLLLTRAVYTHVVGVCILISMR